MPDRSQPLSPTFRSRLAKTVLEARRTAEAAGRESLDALAVGLSEPHSSLSLTQKALRNELRARGRQLGDHHDRHTRTQEIGRLVHEVAYEQWHRLLFARFLAENGLLVEPNTGVPVSLDECGDLAREARADPWALAGRFAQEMLPGVFRQRDPVLEVALPPEARLKLQELVELLPRDVFLADDSLGWTYQFWQAERKDEVNQSGVKIGAEELPAVTQLFTERYMVLFLFHNTIGAWRAGKVLAKSAGIRDDRSEDDLRRAVRIEAGGGYDFSYLRFVRDDQSWRPAAGRFEKWPRTAAELRVLDPCCGSGHFLVEALELLTRLRMEEEGLSVQEAVTRVLRDNLHGLEIDPRCTQIAAFNLAFAAWRMVGRPFELPQLNVACSGLAPNCSDEEWMAVAAGAEAAMGMEGKRDLFEPEPSLAEGFLADEMAALHKVFQRTPDYGSLIDPAVQLTHDLSRASFEQVLAGVLDRERQRSPTDYERALAAEGMARAAELLTATYTLVVTNVPFLVRGKQSAVLRRFAEEQYGEAKRDLATLFLARIFRWLGTSGTQALVAPQNWLFLKSYRKLRERLLKQRTYNMAARLGTGAFETISGHVVNVSLNILSADVPTSGWQMAGMDVSATRGQTPIPAAEKASLLTGPAPVHLAKQKDQLMNPDAVILLQPIGDRTLLSTVAHGHKGITTADNACLGRKFWEMSPEQSHSRSDLDKWIWWQSTVRTTTHYGGRENVVYREAGQEEVFNAAIAYMYRGAGIWNRLGVAVSQMGTLPVTLYTGEKFDTNVAGVGPLDKESLLAVWAYCASPEYSRAVREIDHALKVTNATLVKAPFDLEYWTKVARDLYPHGLPEPYSDDPTQWLFHGHPCGSVVWDEDAKQLTNGPLRIDSTVLQVAVARLLGYRWPAEHDATMRLSDESRVWVERSNALAHFADRDGIVCIPPVGGERAAQDRLRDVLAASYGPDWSAALERRLLAASSTNSPPPPPPPLDEWLRDHFFSAHSRLFHNRPFAWHIWDGRRDGFHALVNYHRLAGPHGEGRRTLDALTYRYLGDWIERQRAEQQEGKAGADARLAAALDLQAQLERIATGEPPCDILVRWRPLHRQPIGWEPDIDDGVRFNIRPFMRAELRAGGRKGAGILRWKPNVKWGKDRGKEPEHHRDTGRHVRPRKDFPWFWGCPGGGTERQRTDFQGGPTFDGNRWNDLHYTRAVKEAARYADGRKDVVQ